MLSNEIIQNIDISRLNCGIAVFQYNGKRGTIEGATDNFYKILGYSEAEYNELTENQYGLRTCVSDDLTAKKAYFDECAAGRKPFKIEVECRAKYGSIKRLRFNFSVVEINGGIYKLYAVVIDVNDEMETEKVVISNDHMTYKNRAIEVINNAKKALNNNEFIVYYQPKIALNNSCLVGAEALIRWKKDGKLIPPNDFIPYLEQNGMIADVDYYVYEKVCSFIRMHLDNDLPIVPISVNLSRVHLRDPEFIVKIKNIIEKYNIPPSLMEFELTENIFLENQNAAVVAMEEMKKIGVMVSLDDFGSGFSSLNLLRNLPVDIIKIDKEFFGNETFKTNDKIIISSLINMAGKLKIAVICEGVETGEQVRFLKENHCDMAQGFFFAKPVPEEEFEMYLKNKSIPMIMN